jgi:formylglycine-generating enzyme required for sulfatase activity
MEPPPPLPLPPVVPTANPCTANEAYVQFGDADEVMGAICAGRTEVTVAEYESCVQARRCDDRELRCGSAANWGHADRASHPINCVSARQAEAYCAWQRARLPTLLEFQNMASAHERSDYPWGDDDPQGRVCWSGERPRRGTCPVGTYPKGAGRGGMVDLVGNVWEWTGSEKRRDRVFA